MKKEPKNQSTESGLNNEQITKAIIDYITEETYNYAVLINGDWGIGKTYFVKEVLKPKTTELSKKKTIVYISLYGLTDVEKLSSQIYLEILSANSERARINKGVVHFADGASGIISDVAKNFNFNLPNKNDVFRTFGRLFKFEKYVFIFDDLERCFVNINDVLGYINRFVEQNGAKTIIIANEKEIENSFARQNIELKYLVALTAENMLEKKSLPKKTRNSVSNNAKKEKGELEKLVDKTEYIFNQNFHYRKIKEKLIGVTLNYQPNPEETIASLYDKIFANGYDKSFKSALLEQTKYICSDENCYNLRSIQYAFYFVKRICALVNKNKSDFTNDQYIFKVMKDIIQDVVCETIKRKNGDNNECEDLLDALYIHYTHYSFNFTNEYIEKGVFNDENVFSEIKARYQKEENQDDPLNKLQRYTFLNDNEINENLAILLKNFNDDKYDVGDFEMFLSILINLNHLGFYNDINFIFKEIKEKISKTQISADYCHHGDVLGFNDKELHEKYEKYFTELRNEIYSSQIEKAINALSQIFNDTNWEENFERYCYDNSSFHYQNQAFLSMLGNDLLSKTIAEATNKQLIYFRNGIRCVYKRIETLNSNDIASINELKTVIESFINSPIGNIRKHNLNLILTELENIINKFEPQNQQSTQEIDAQNA